MVLPGSRHTVKFCTKPCTMPCGFFLKREFCFQKVVALFYYLTFPRLSFSGKLQLRSRRVVNFRSKNQGQLQGMLYSQRGSLIISASKTHGVASVYMSLKKNLKIAKHAEKHSFNPASSTSY